MEWSKYGQERPDKPFRVVAFGSSNTGQSWANVGRHNWVDWLALNMREHIGKHVHVLNQGIGGDTTLQLLDRLDRDVLSIRPDLVIITIGGNDAAREMIPADYSLHLRDICMRIAAVGAQPLLQTYYCPQYELGPSAFRPRFEANMQAKRELASELGLPLVDQYRHFEPLYRNHPDTYALIMRDWLHVNHFGNLMMGQYVSRQLGLPALPVPEDMLHAGQVPAEWLK